MSTDVQTVPAFSAFENQLRTLCIKEFPCGSGKWREPEKQSMIPKKRSLRSVSGRVRPPPPIFSFQQEPDPQQERTEVLQELVIAKSSPWHLDYSWSSEAEKLRELSVRSPWLINDSFVLNHFRTLKIVDKGVTDVDEGLLKLQNLEELTLTANLIRTVSSKHLPQTLQVLELCANEITDISTLCVQPPLLLHLGLGYNRIYVIADHITGSYWPALLSLDLSHNYLTDLLEIVRKLSTLPKLRNLILIGNPLSLIPGYRGYIIDSLRNLSILDDNRISADERHHFKGLAHRKENILDEAKITLEVAYLKGLPIPEEMRNTNEQPEFPIVERLYFIQFMFPMERANPGIILQERANPGIILQDSHHAFATVHDIENEPVPSDGISVFSDATLKSNLSQTFTNPCTGVEMIDATQEQQTLHNKDLLAANEKEHNKAPVDSGVKLVAIKTQTTPWDEEVELNWKQDLTRDDLIALKNFFKQGMEFSVMEQVVLCFPEEPKECDESPAGSKKGKDKDKDKNKKDVKDKDDKKKKKKGEVDIELRREPPQYNTIAKFHIPLENFLDGEFEFSSVFTMEMPSFEQSPESKKDVKDKKKEPPPSDKKGKDDKKDVAKGGKDDKKGKGKTSPLPDGETPPPTLEVPVIVRLHHWTTAMDSLKEEEQKQGTEQKH